ncbi:MAG: hypothetical protein ACYS0F_15100 [Planctomycetota bacterium]|jgi:hypothetical protein
MKDAGTLTMSTKKLCRLDIAGRVAERRLTQRKAAEQVDVGAFAQDVSKLSSAEAASLDMNTMGGVLPEISEQLAKLA